MNTRTLSRFRLFGKAGRLVMTVLSIVAALITVFCGLAAAYVARLPEAAPAEYNAKKLVAVFVLAELFAASAAGALWMLRGLFAVLTRCDSPFCGDVVARLRSFGFSLLPVAVFASASDTLTGRFLSAGKGGVSIQWGILLAFVVTMALVAVFRYGVQLQKESDETL